VKKANKKMEQKILMKNKKVLVLKKFEAKRFKKIIHLRKF
jgi:hypothetical protein